jgi:ArsR family transcriptional regulator, arsenate/arsenite/antimonite-responsive transcriptional repressor
LRSRNVKFRACLDHFDVHKNIKDSENEDYTQNEKMTEKELAKISKALSDPTRLRLYETIAARKEVFCGELMPCCPLTRGTVSHHLKILSEANLIESRREGQFIYNRAIPETLREYTRALTKIAGKTKAASKY